MSKPTLKGCKWKVIVNGRRALNGERYGATYTGEIQQVTHLTTIYGVAEALLDHVEEKNREMELPDSFQLTIDRAPVNRKS